MAHELHLEPKYFRQVFNGEKEYELRLYDSKRQTYQDKDILCVEEKYSGRYFTAVITRVQYFLYFNQVFEAIDYRKFLPDATSLADAIETYESFPGYTEKARQMGVLVFKITRISEITE